MYSLSLYHQHENRLAEAHSLYGRAWMTSAVTEAYSSVYGVEWLPPVSKDMLIEGDCTVAIVKQRAGRPKKKGRRESQISTRNLTACYKCCSCGGRGDNRRGCPDKNSNCIPITI